MRISAASPGARAAVSPAAAVAGVRKSREEIAGEIVELVRETVGPVAALRKVLFVRALPKTRSGKIPRVSLGHLVNGKPYQVGPSESAGAAQSERLIRLSPQISPTIEDPDVFAEIEHEADKALRRHGR